MTKPNASRAACAALLLASAPAGAAPPPATAAAVDPAVNRLLDDFIAAQRGFDQRALGELTTPDYLEVSPVGDVDTRDEMLGFYAPDKKGPSPEITLSERVVRPFASGAVVVAKLTLAAPGPGGATRPMAMRATYVVRRVGRGWKLAAAQYTPIRAG